MKSKVFTYKYEEFYVSRYPQFSFYSMDSYKNNCYHSTKMRITFCRENIKLTDCDELYLAQAKMSSNDTCFNKWEKANCMTFYDTDVFTIALRPVIAYVSDSQKSIETKLNDFTASVKTEVQTIKELVNEFKSSIGTDIDTIKTHLTEHTKRLDNSEDDINRMKLATEVHSCHHQLFYFTSHRHTSNNTFIRCI